MGVNLYANVRFWGWEVSVLRTVSLELGDHFSLYHQMVVGPRDVSYSLVRARVLTFGRVGQDVGGRGGSQPGRQGGGGSDLWFKKGLLGHSLCTNPVLLISPL